MMKIPKKKQNIIIWFFLILQVLIILTQGIHDYPDSSTYVESARYIMHGGELEERHTFRMLRPLPLLLANAFGFFGLEFGFIIQNIIFLVLSVIVFQKVMEQIYYEKAYRRVPFYSTLLFTIALPILEYGLAILSDMGAWFFFLLALLFYLKSIKRGIDFKYSLLGGFFGGLGVLMKQNSAASSLFFGLYLLWTIILAFALKNKDKKLIVFDKLKKGILFCTSFAIPNVVASIWVYVKERFTHLDQFDYITCPEKYYTLTWFILTFFQAFTILVPFFFLGLYRIIMQKKQRLLLINILLIVSIIVPILGFPAFNDRYTFLLFPVVLPLSVLGIEQATTGLNKVLNMNLKWPMIMAVIIFLFFLCNNVIYWHIRAYGFECLSGCLFNFECLANYNFEAICTP